jgi:hypothetical protein
LKVVACAAPAIIRIGNSHSIGRRNMVKTLSHTEYEFMDHLERSCLLICWDYRRLRSIAVWQFFNV